MFFFLQLKIECFISFFPPYLAAYDSSGSIPTTDLSVATAGTGTAESSSTMSQSARGAPPLPVPRSHRLMSSSSDDPFMSPIPKVCFEEKKKKLSVKLGIMTRISAVV